MKSLKEAAGVLRSHGMEDIANKLDIANGALASVSEFQYRPQRETVARIYNEIWAEALSHPENGYLWQAVAWLAAEIIDVFGV